MFVPQDIGYFLTIEYVASIRRISSFSNAGNWASARNFKVSGSPAHSTAKIL